MRPTKRPQSALRCPLNHVLGTEAAVRVLRVVMLTEIPIGVSELARLAELQPSGVARVCERLEDLGVIEAVGRGVRNRQFRRAPRFALGEQLVGLFSEERDRAQQIMQELRNVVRSVSPQAKAAWIEGSVAQGIDVPGDAIVVGLLVEPSHVESARDQVWAQLLAIQRRRDVVMDLRVLTMAELGTADQHRRAELERVELLTGPAPLDLIRTGRPVRMSGPRLAGHAQLDARSKEIARVIADRIRRDPSLVEDARRYLERRIPSASPGERLELEEWQGILATMSVSRLRRFLVQEDARATRLRQSLPFLNALKPDERRRLLAESGAG
jgi:DNA-binding Lrp family transcriptional regulator